MNKKSSVKTLKLICIMRVLLIDDTMQEKNEWLGFMATIGFIFLSYITVLAR